MVTKNMTYSKLVGVCSQHYRLTVVSAPQRVFAAGDAYICASGWEEGEDSLPVTRMLSMAEKMLAATQLMVRAAHTYTNRAVMLCHYILSSVGLAPSCPADMNAVQA